MFKRCWTKFLDFHKPAIKNMLVFLLRIRAYLLYMYYKIKQVFIWLIKRLAISIGIAWAIATFFGTFATVYVGFGLVLFPTGTEGAAKVLEAIPVLMFKLFFGFLVAVFIFVCIPQGYNILKSLFSPKEQLKSLQGSVNRLSREIKEMKKQYKRHITEQHHTGEEEAEETKDNRQGGANLIKR